MKTASYFTYDGPGRIGITVGSPRGIPAGYRFYRNLAPRRDMLKMTTADYTREFDAILNALDPQGVWDELHDLTGGHEPVLLCFERPPFSSSNWCHRRLVANWFLATLDEEVPEFGHGMLAVMGAGEHKS